MINKFNKLKQLNLQDEEKELLLNFFLTYSCFEFALKATDFARPTRRIEKDIDVYLVSTNWDSYATSIKDKFDKTDNEDLNKASDYLLQNPPMQQVIFENNLMWNTITPNDNLTDIEKLLKLISHIRNNLFHGGKFDIEVHEQAERTEYLLRYGLIILEECLRLTPDVKKAFDRANLQP